MSIIWIPARLGLCTGFSHKTDRFLLNYNLDYSRHKDVNATKKDFAFYPWERLLLCFIFEFLSSIFFNFSQHSKLLIRE